MLLESAVRNCDDFSVKENDIESILDPSGKKCKPKAEGGESSDDEPTGSEALAAEVGFLTPSFTTI